MHQSRLAIALALGVLCAACGQKGAVTTTTATATTTTATTPAATAALAQSSAAPDPDAQCKSWGIEPGTPGFKQCVDGMKEAANADAGATPSSADAQARMATMHAEMARQGDAMRTQISDEVKAAASNPKCVTVTNGTNTSVSCP